MKDEIEKKLSGEIANLITELMSSGKSRDEKLVAKWMSQADIFEQLRLSQRNIRSSLSELLNSLDDLRFTIKYLVFDLEATRRENEYLIQLLNEKKENEL